VLIITSKQELLRERVVTFYLKQYPKPKSYTVKHFIEEGVPQSTIYNIIKNYNNRLTTKRAGDSGGHFHVMT